MEVIANYVNANRLVVLVSATFIIAISMVVLLPFSTLASTEILSFNFPNQPNGSWSSENLTLTGDTSVSQDGIVLTLNSNWSSGWATHYKPLHLWDAATGRVADFTSNFSFVIQSDPAQLKYGDGMTFFLTPNGTTIPENEYGGASFALDQPFVAVEFDTYYDRNPWDPRYEHVGIDISRITSVATAPWKWNRIRSGGGVNALVVYNFSRQLLSVTMTDVDNSISFSTVNYSVNLKDHLPEWVTFGFSASTGAVYETHTIKSWNFMSSLEVTSNHNVQVRPAPASPSLPPRKKMNNYWQWIVTGVGSFLLLCFVLGFLWSRHQSKRNGGNLSEDDGTVEPIDQEFSKVTGPRRFPFKEVAAATDDFSKDRLLGEGGFGKVYKGYLREGDSEVAIKKISPESRQGIKEYATEVKTITQLRHRNLVQLVGWCQEKKELLLIYEFMSNGSLDTHLFQGKSLLTWEMRHKITQGLASALLYLHEEWEQCVLHRDVKASNIMLDAEFNAKLGDFGLARLVDHMKGSQTTVLAGTMGYMAPECVYTGKVSKESDIYSFGVVILEIVCGRKVNDPRDVDGHIRLVDWVWKLYGIGRLLDAVDPKLEGNYDQGQMQCLMVVGLWCVNPDYNCRPSIREALGVLNFEALPPILPSIPPVPTYANPHVYGPFPSLHSSYNITSSSNEYGGGYTTTGSLAISNKYSGITPSLASSMLLVNAE